MKKYPNIEYAQSLDDRALEALEAGHHLEAAIIIYQSLEIFLRISIKAYGDSAGVHEDTLKKCSESETSFYKLTIFFDLIYPENETSKDLRKLNDRRNKLMHKLFFEFTENQYLNESLKTFCLEGVKLQNKLRDQLLNGTTE